MEEEYYHPTQFVQLLQVRNQPLFNKKGIKITKKTGPVGILADGILNDDFDVLRLFSYLFYRGWWGVLTFLK